MAKASNKKAPKAKAKQPKPTGTPAPPRSAASADNGRHSIAATLLSGLTFEPCTLETIFARCGFDPARHGKYAVANARKTMLALIRAGKADRPAKGLYSLPAALAGNGQG